MKLKYNKKAAATGQALIMIIAIFAFAFMIAGSLPKVSAVSGGNACNSTTYVEKCNGDGEVWMCSDGKVDSYACGEGDKCISGSCITPDSSKDKEKETTIQENNGLENIPDAIKTEFFNILKQEGTRKAWDWLKSKVKEGKISSKDAGALNTAGKELTKIPFKEWFSEGQGIGGTASWSQIAAGALAAITTAITIASLIKKNFNERNSRGVWGIAVGAAAVGTVFGAYLAPILFTSAGAGPVGLVAAAVVIVIMAIWMGSTFKDFYQELMTYTPQAWQAPIGSENQKCLECNDKTKNEFGCSEYLCHSLGAACEIINEGEVEERCVEIPNDRKPPIVSPLESSLGEDYKYSEDPSSVPGHLGIKILYDGQNSDAQGCIPPFSDITIGVEVDEPAQCKIDREDKMNFDDMNSFMDSSLFVEEHEVFIPGAASQSVDSLTFLGAPTLYDDEDYQFFIRCRDYHGTESTSNLMMEFCVQEGPDVSSPIIKGTNYVEGAFIQNNQTEIPLEVYTNEPADCKWDFQDKSYSEMGNNMTDCSVDGTDFLYANSYTYGCRTDLTGFKDGTENKYYIRCLDKPWWVDGMQGSRIANSQSYPLTLVGTNPLAISTLTIDGEEEDIVIKDSTGDIKVAFEAKTIGGAEEGKAQCQYSFDGGNSYSAFYNNGNQDYTITNTHNEWLGEGDYTLDVMCYDLALNVAEKQINFTVETDLNAPIVARAFYQSNKMNLVTDEEASCVYSITNCEYDFLDGIEITSSIDKLTHTLPWDTQTELFVKCRDNFGNVPAINDCSIKVRAYENFEETS